MNSLKLTFLFALALFFCENVFSLDTASARYFPLNVGNAFYFKVENKNPGGTIVSYSVSRIERLQIYNGKTYYYCTNFLGLGNANDNANYYLRYDSLTGNLVRYDSYFSSCNNEVILYKLSASVGDTIGTLCAGNVNMECTRIADTLIFGNNVNFKKFGYYYYNNGYQTIKEAIFAKTKGVFFSRWNVTTIHSFQDRKVFLKGARINGVIYGDTLLGLSNVSNEIPKYYELSQNYPNPFNPGTNIGFRIAEFGFVRIIVYDALGKEVQTLVNQELSAGTYEIEFDGSELPSGVYYYKLEAGGFTGTKRMVLIK